MRPAKGAAPQPRSDGVITALPVRRGRSERLVLYIDGARVFDLACVIADLAGLHVGDTLSVDAQQRLIEQDAPYRAKDRALGLLALRDRSCHEVAERLRTAGYDPEIVSGTVAWLRELDYLNDARFAAAYVSTKLRCGWGQRRISSELSLKGVERAVIEEAVGEQEITAESATEGMETVLSLARRRFGTQFQSDAAGAARRLAGFLGRRGYDWDTIRVVTRVLSDEAAAESGLSSP